MRGGSGGKWAGEAGAAGVFCAAGSKYGDFLAELAELAADLEAEAALK